MKKYFQNFLYCFAFFFFGGFFSESVFGVNVGDRGAVRRSNGTWTLNAEVTAMVPQEGGQPPMLIVEWREGASFLEKSVPSDYFRPVEPTPPTQARPCSPAPELRLSPVSEFKIGKKVPFNPKDPNILIQKIQRTLDQKMYILFQSQQRETTDFSYYLNPQHPNIWPILDNGVSLIQTSFPEIHRKNAFSLIFEIPKGFSTKQITSTIEWMKKHTGTPTANAPILGKVFSQLLSALDYLQQKTPISGDGTREGKPFQTLDPSQIYIHAREANDPKLTAVTQDRVIIFPVVLSENLMNTMHGSEGFPAEAYTAPELMAHGSSHRSEKSLVWSLGLILAEAFYKRYPIDNAFPPPSGKFQLIFLVGALIHWTQEKSTQIRGITEQEAKKDPLLNEARDVILACTQNDPSSRPSLRELLQMPFFSHHSVAPQPALMPPMVPESATPSSSAR